MREIDEFADQTEFGATPDVERLLKACHEAILVGMVACSRSKMPVAQIEAEAGQGRDRLAVEGNAEGIEPARIGGTTVRKAGAPAIGEERLRQESRVGIKHVARQGIGAAGPARDLVPAGKAPHFGQLVFFGELRGEHARRIVPGASEGGVILARQEPVGAEISLQIEGFGIKREIVIAAECAGAVFLHRFQRQVGVDRKDRAQRQLEPKSRLCRQPIQRAVFIAGIEESACIGLQVQASFEDRIGSGFVSPGVKGGKAGHRQRRQAGRQESSHREAPFKMKGKAGPPLNRGKRRFQRE